MHEMRDRTGTSFFISTHDPAIAAIENFDEVRRMLLADEVIGPRVELGTGQVLVQGMLSYAERQMTTPFLGLGVFPADLERIWRGNRYGVADVRELKADAALFASGPAGVMAVASRPLHAPGTTELFRANWQKTKARAASTRRRTLASSEAQTQGQWPGWEAQRGSQERW